jgi:hypothetical protein
MAHYAALDSSNVVKLVFVGRDEDDLIEGVTSWEDYYSADGLTAKRTSYNTHGGVHSDGGTPFRKNYAGIGYSYDTDRDAFIPPKPFDSWILDEETCLWEAPVTYPTDGFTYIWNESETDWELQDFSEGTE